MRLNVISSQFYASLLMNPHPWLLTSMLRRINMPLQSHLLHVFLTKDHPPPGKKQKLPHPPSLCYKHHGMGTSTRSKIRVNFARGRNPLIPAVRNVYPSRIHGRYAHTLLTSPRHAIMRALLYSRDITGGLRNTLYKFD